jgi:uncharacterized protein YndB with AHSA1/START domain
MAVWRSECPLATVDGMIGFRTSIAIERPIAEVFAYVADPGNFPVWNSAVQEVKPTSRDPLRVGSTYRMERELPTGPAVNQLEIVARESPREFAIRTTAGPTPFHYRYRFAGKDDATVIEFDGQVDLPSVAGLMPQLVRRGVEHNLTTLKLVLEGGRPS